MIINKRTQVEPLFDSGYYKGMFKIQNKYLSYFWFRCDAVIWNELSVAFAVVTEKIVNSHLPEILNEEALKKLDEVD